MEREKSEWIKRGSEGGRKERMDGEREKVRKGDG